MDLLLEAQQQYEHIQQNEFSYRKHKKQKDEDIAICECKFDATDIESACGERCLNVLTSTECTPGYCRCGIFCKNQRFQRCEYAKTKFLKTEGRGWGLLADEDIKAGQFIIEYCGEVISWKEAKRRSQAYENQGLKDAFIISLNSSESIDATRKGSLARFINHSCQPNCETRKWNVLGEIRVGIFAKQDISLGTELGYDYNFEWYGGAKVRCLCGAASCTGFLGAKSRGFQEDTYLWEDDDDRYSVEKIPLYDSEEDEPASKLLKMVNSSHSEFDASGNVECSVTSNFTVACERQSEYTLNVKPLASMSAEGSVVKPIKIETRKDLNVFAQDDHRLAFVQNNEAISLNGSVTACSSYRRGPISKKRPKLFPNAKKKKLAQTQVDAKHVVKLLALKEAQDEVIANEEMKNGAASQLDSLYNEIRPAIEEHERDHQDSVATSVAEKWIEACCLKLKAEFDLYSSIIKNVVCTPRRALDQQLLSETGINDSEVKYLGF